MAGPEGDGCCPRDRRRWPEVRGQASGDDRVGPGVEMAVTKLEICEDRPGHGRLV